MGIPNERRLRFFPSKWWQRLAILLWVLILTGGTVRALVRPTPTHIGIYSVYAEGGRNWRAGAPLYSHGDGWNVFPYSPLLAAQFAPWSALPDGLASALWHLLVGGVFLLALAWWSRTALPAGPAALRRPLLLLLVIPLAATTILSGQIGGVVAAAILLSVAAAAEERWNLSAIAVVLACLIKVYPLSIALLLALCYPRRMLPRLAVASVVGLALPFLLQRPGYVVEQYAGWLRLMADSDRLNWPLAIANRNVSLLFRVWLTPLSHAAHVWMQLLTAGTIASLCLALRRREHGGLSLPPAILGLGGCWMTLFGPVVESYTYILVGPSLAWMLVQAGPQGRSWAYRVVLGTSWCLFTAVTVAVWFPNPTRWQCLGVHPFAGLLLLGCLLWDVLPDLRLRNLVAATGIRETHELLVK